MGYSTLQYALGVLLSGSASRPFIQSETKIGQYFYSCAGATVCTLQPTTIIY